MCSFKLNKSLYLFKFAIYVLITSRLPIFYKLYCSFLIFFILYRNINNAYKKNYESDKEHYLNASRDYYNYNKEYILKKAKDKHNNSHEDKNKKLQYSKNRYHNMSPEKKLKLNEYQKNYQKNYRDKKKREHSNFNKNAVVTP